MQAGKKKSMFRIIARKISVYTTVAYFYIRRAIARHPRCKKRWTFDYDAKQTFGQWVAGIPSDKVFVHVALSSVNRFSETKKAYPWLRDLLLKHFNTVSSQAFTPGVRKTKVFDPDKEVPAYGAFARLFFRDMGFRNHDPCYSVMALGGNGFREQDFSFSANGIFRQMIEQDFYCINIGLEYVTCSVMHFVEYEQKVPYLRFFDDTYYIQSGNATRKIIYPVHDNRGAYSVKGYVWWNKVRLMKDLSNTGIVQSVNIQGVRLYGFGMRHLYEFVTRKVQSDPFYLIKW